MLCVTLTNTSAYVYFTADKAVISCSLVGNPYSSIIFVILQKWLPNSAMPNMATLCCLQETVLLGLYFSVPASNSAISEYSAVLSDSGD